MAAFALTITLALSVQVNAQSVYTGNVISSQTSTSTVAGGAATFDDLATTGVSVNVTGLSGITSLTATTQLLSGSSPGVPPFSGSSSDIYIDVQITLPPGTNPQPGATVSICTTNPVVTTGDTLHFWDGSHWSAATHVTTVGDEICGQVPLSALTGTNFVISQLSAATTPSSGPSIYLLLLVPVAAVVVIGAAYWLMRSRKSMTTAVKLPT